MPGGCIFVLLIAAHLDCIMYSPDGFDTFELSVM